MNNKYSGSMTCEFVFKRIDKIVCLLPHITHNTNSYKLRSVAEGSPTLLNISQNSQTLDLTQVWYDSGLLMPSAIHILIHDHKYVNLLHYHKFHRKISIKIQICFGYLQFYLQNYVFISSCKDFSNNAPLELQIIAEM